MCNQKQITNQSLRQTSGPLAKILKGDILSPCTVKESIRLTPLQICNTAVLQSHSPIVQEGLFYVVQQHRKESTTRHQLN